MGGEGGEGGGRWAVAERVWVHEVLSLVQGVVVQLAATLRGWVSLFYYIDKH